MMIARPLRSDLSRCLINHLLHHRPPTHSSWIAPHIYSNNMFPKLKPTTNHQPPNAPPTPPLLPPSPVCPKIIDEFFGEDSERAQEEDEDELSGKELSQGGDAVDFLSDLRSGAGDFYETVLHNIMIYMCEQDIDVNEERCVEFGEAAKDYAGHCVIPDSSPCDATLTSRSEEDVGSGTCERASNCYWDVPVEGETRERRYTDKEALDNEEYLIGASMDSYIGKTAKYLVVGVVLAVLNILIWTIFTIGRCCCCCLHSVCFCRCCSWKPKEEVRKNYCEERSNEFPE